MMSESPEQRLRDLLRDDEAIPTAVLRCASVLGDLSIWHQFSRNLPATSCRDAARKRIRLGATGIPLCDELKSFLGEARLDGSWRLFAAHCRADRDVDFEKLRGALDNCSEIRRATAECITHLGMEYGTVNPFEAVGLEQIFDDELRVELTATGTVMTNAGDPTWAVEFRAGDLVPGLARSRWADVVVRSRASSGRPRHHQPLLGIITGDPPEVGLELWRTFNACVRQQFARHALQDVGLPQVMALFVPKFGLSLEARHRSVALKRAVLESVDRLIAAGATLVANPSPLLAAFDSDIAQHAAERQVEMLSLADVVMTEIATCGLSQIALLDIEPEATWVRPRSAAASQVHGVTVHRPAPYLVLKLRELALEVRRHGASARALNFFRDVLRAAVPPSCDLVVLAMSELSLLYREAGLTARIGVPVLDPIAVYARALALRYVDHGIDRGLAVDLEQGSISGLQALNMGDSEGRSRVGSPPGAQSCSLSGGVDSS